jgi:pyridoxamine 5'-phosphate oxidase
MAELRKSAVDPDPLEQFRRWYADADGAEIRAPQAMALATSTAEGAPSVRMVLLKGADERGFVFHRRQPEGR